MSFMQVFGATILAVVCYVLVVVCLSFMLSCVGYSHDTKDFMLTVIIIGGAMFMSMFITWYMGVPVPEWLK